MNIQSLKPAVNSRFSQKRLGRGIGSGIGKTSGKGHKGQNARSGGGVRLGFEGGQMPLIRKLPRRGFTNADFKKVYSIVNLADLNKFDENSVVDAKSLVEKGILSKVDLYIPLYLLHVYSNPRYLAIVLYAFSFFYAFFLLPESVYSVVEKKEILATFNRVNQSDRGRTSLLDMGTRFAE